MGAMSPARRNRFRPVDSASILAALGAVGSYDPDVLYAWKQRLLAPYRNMRRVAIAGVLAGCALVFLLAMPLVGILVFASSAMLWWFQAKQVAQVESGYAQYLASAKS